MRIAIWYHTNFGRNDGPPLYWFNALRKAKNLEIMHLKPEGDISRFGDFDWHIVVDYGEDGLPVNHKWQLPKKGKRLYVCSDAHYSPKAMTFRFRKAHNFDYVFFNQYKFLAQFKRWSKRFAPKTSRLKDYWFLPHAVEPQAYPKYTFIKKYDVCFIGHIQDTKNYNGMTRLRALDRLFREFPNFYFGVRNGAFPEKNMFEHASQMFAKSKIVFNISIKDDINMRLFEAMASGSFQLTNYIPTLTKLFKGKRCFATYKSYKDMIDKVHYYLGHGKEREEIAKLGYKETIGKHTYQHRIKEAFNKVGEVIKF